MGHGTAGQQEIIQIHALAGLYSTMTNWSTVRIIPEKGWSMLKYVEVCWSNIFSEPPVKESSKSATGMLPSGICHDIPAVIQEIPAQRSTKGLQTSANHSPNMFGLLDEQLTMIGDQLTSTNYIN